jgi:hypothetical protein
MKIKTRNAVAAFGGSLAMLSAIRGVAHADQLSADRKRNQKPPSDRIEQMRNFRSKLNLTCFLPNHHRSYQ